MKNILKQINLFYGVVILLISILILRPSLLAGLSAAEINAYENMFITFIIGAIAALISLVAMEYAYCKVIYGAIKSIDDIRYVKPNRIILFFMCISIIVFLITFLYQLPTLCSVSSAGFMGIIPGKSPLSYGFWGLFINTLILIYLMFFTKSLENELPRRRRAIKNVRVDINDFLYRFIPHIPNLLNIILAIVFFLRIKNMW